LKKRSLKTLAFVLLIVTLFGNVTPALASTVSFRRTNGNIHMFDRTSINSLVGDKKANTKLTVSIVQAAHNKVSTFTPKLDVDGYFGTLTHGGIIRFQSRYNLVTDGVCGKDTWARIHGEFGANAPGKHYLPFILS